MSPWWFVGLAAAAGPEWPCPVATCEWDPQATQTLAAVPLQVSPEAPLTWPVSDDHQWLELVLMPTAGPVRGRVLEVAWERAAHPVSDTLLGGRQVWAADATGSAPQALPVPLGTGTDDQGGTTALTGSRVVLKVPAGTTGATVRVLDRRTHVAVLAHQLTSEPTAWPLGPQERPAGADWGPFAIAPAGPLALPRPAALPAPVPVTTPLISRDGALWEADGRRAHLSGMNLVVQWDLPTADESERLAATLATLGVNLVRLRVFGVSRAALYEGEPVRVPTDEEWVLFDQLVDALARHGIRLALPLIAVDYRPGRGPEGTLDRALVARGLPIWRPEAMAHQQAAITGLLGRASTVRGVALARDPALAIVEIANESGLTRSWAAGAHDQLPMAWRSELETLWRSWLEARYATDDALALAWAGSLNPGLQPGESLATRVPLQPSNPRRWGSWPAQRRADLAAFHLGLDAAYYDGMRTFLEGALATTALVVGTQYLNVREANTLFADWPLGDSHHQLDQPSGPTQEQTRASLLAAPFDRGLRRTVGQAVLGQPFYLGEVNQGWPSPFDYEAPLVLSGLAARQGWSGYSWHIWSPRPWSADTPNAILGPMDLAANPTKLGQLPVAAAVLRGGLIQPAEGLLVQDGSVPGPVGTGFPVGTDTPGSGDLQLWLDHRVRTAFEPAALAPQPGAPGPVTWDPDETLVIDAPGVAAVISTGQTRRTTVLEAGGGPGAVSVVGLDAVPLDQAQRWLLTVGTRSANVGLLEASGHTIVARGDGPVLLAPYAGDIWLFGSHRRAPQVTRLGPDGAPDGTVPVSWARDRGAWRIDVAALPPSPWYTVTWPD